MLSCLVLGDSIAVGTAMYKPHCELHAKVGINSLAWTQHYLTNDLGANKVIISLGSNDWNSGVTKHALETLRSNITSESKVIWLIPAIKPAIRTIVENIAHAHGDGMIDLLLVPRCSDHIHPTDAGYKLISHMTS